MAAINDITGDSIQSRVPSKSYLDNYENIFKKDKMTPRVTENVEEIGKCGCGRSPTGKCIGWHSFSEEEFRDALAVYEDNQRKENQK